MKKNDNIFIIIAVVTLILFIYGGQQGWFKGSSQTFYIYNTTIVEILKNAPDGSCSARVNPNPVYVGGLVTGTVTDGANTNCEVYLGVGDDWTLFGEGVTNNVGILTMNGNPVAPGVFTFRAICGDCVTNAVTLTVNPVIGPDTDGDGIPDVIDDDDDNDGYLDIEEIAAGTNPLDPSSHPTDDTCNTQCVSKGFLSGRGPFESGSSCTGTEVIDYLVGESGLICCCLPAGGELPMTASECQSWMTSMGKTSYTLTTTSMDLCGSYAWNSCNNIGKTLKYFDFHPNCCIWSCNE